MKASHKILLMFLVNFVVIIKSQVHLSLLNSDNLADVSFVNFDSNSNEKLKLIIENNETIELNKINNNFYAFEKDSYLRAYVLFTQYDLEDLSENQSDRITIEVQYLSELNSTYNLSSNSFQLLTSADNTRYFVKFLEDNSKEFDSIPFGADIDDNNILNRDVNSNLNTSHLSLKLITFYTSGALCYSLLQHTNVNKSNFLDYCDVHEPSHHLPVQDKLKLGVEKANLALIQSGVLLSVELVHTELSSYVEDTTNMMDMLQLLSYSYDGVMDDVLEKRNIFHADFVSLFVYGDDLDYCGLAYAPFPSQKAVSPIHGYSVNNIACIEFDVVAHEIGHNLGCYHNVEHSFESHPYAHGYISPDESFRTIMAIHTCDKGNSCPFSINYYSNQIARVQELPVGSQTQDCARRLREMAYSASRLRSDDCRDVTGFVDTIGYNCDTYADLGLCHGNQMNGLHGVRDNSSPNEACCVCGGGIPVKPLLPGSPPSVCPSFDTAETSKNILTAHSDETYGDANYTQAGIMFDVITKKGISIESMGLHIGSVGDVIVELWTKIHSHQGFERDMNRWAPIVPSLCVRSNGQGKLTPLGSSFNPISLPRGARQALYITLSPPATSPSPSFVTGMLYNSATKVGHVAIENEDIWILEGLSKWSPSFGRNGIPKRFSGMIGYNLHDYTSPPASAPVIVPPTTPNHNSPVSRRELATTMNGKNTQAGCMFDIVAIRKLLVRSMSIHSTDKMVITVELWRKSGSYVGYERDENAWTYVMTRSLTGNGPHESTRLGEFKNFVVKQGETHALYVTQMNPGMLFTSMTPTSMPAGTVYSKNMDLKIMVGISKWYRFSRNGPHKLWNGSIGYGIVY